MKHQEKKIRGTYFPHDANAHNDPKILMMISVYGFKSYGWYWRVLEQMRNETDYKLCVSGKFALNGIAQMFNETDTTDVERWLNDCTTHFNLFETDGEHVWSNSFIGRMKNIESRINAASVAGKRSAERRYKMQETKSESNELNERSTGVEHDVNNVKVKVNRNKKVNKDNKYIDDDIIRESNYWLSIDFQNAWMSYCEMRTKRKYPISARAAKLLLNALDEIASGDIQSAIRAIDRAENSGWRMFYPENQNVNSSNKKQPNGFVNDAYTATATSIK